MKGIINTPLNVRQRPSVNSRLLGYYDSGDFVEVVDSVEGDLYDGDDIWFKLEDGSYVWSTAVDIEPDSKLSPEDRQQWLLCYRKVGSDGRPDMHSSEPAKKLSITRVMLPADGASVRLEPLEKTGFPANILQSIEDLQDSRQHVFIYIHGYQVISSLKLDLLFNFVQNYMEKPGSNIAKVLFFTWPAQGGPSRKTADDQSLHAGQEFTRNGLLSHFQNLSGALEGKQLHLNLIVHSFGHQLLNGILNPEVEGSDERFDHLFKDKIFENVFLMAPDVTHLSIKKGGQRIKNYFQDEDGVDFLYDFGRLNNISKKVHVFHSKYDFLLYSSTKKFVGVSNYQNVATPEARLNLTRNYRNLGNYGDHIPNETIDRIPGFEYVDIDDLIGPNDPVVNDNYPFRRARRSARKVIEDVWATSNYNGVNVSKIIFNARRFPDHHRYLFTCRAVVDEVIRRLL